MINGNYCWKESFMESLFFSLNATIPIFLVMLIGYCLRYTKLVNPTFVLALNRFNYALTLPVLLFMDISTADFYSVWNTSYVLYCFFVTLFCVLMIWLITFLIVRNNPKAHRYLGEFVQASYRSSSAVLGIAFIQNIYGSSVIGPLMILGTVPLYNVMAVIVLSFTAPATPEQNEPNARKKLIKKTLLGILTNPIIISIALGILCSLLRITLPGILSKTFNMIAQLATPLALLALGAGFEGRKALKMIKPTLLSSIIKLLLQPVIFRPLAICLGFRDEQLVALLVMLGAPTTVSSYIMATNMKHEGILTSSIIVSTTFLSSITLTFFLFLLRYFSYI